MNRKPVLIAAFLFCFAQPISAQYHDYTGYSNWEYQIALYSWIIDQEGTATIEGTEIPVDVLMDNFNKLWQRSLNGAIQVRNDKWTILFDGRYIALRDEGVNIDLALLDLVGGYRLTPWFDIMAGGRYFHTDADMVSADNESFKGKKGWFDPVVGARIILPLAKGLYMSARGDVGGFGVGSKFTWQGIGALNWRISNFSLSVGYRIWDVDYESGSGSSLFRYDVTTKGPGLGFTVHF